MVNFTNMGLLQRDEVHQLNPGQGIEPILSEEWAALERTCPRASVAQTLAYAKVAAVHAMNAGQTIFVLTVRDDERLCGVWMLARDNVLFRSSVRPMSSGSNEEYSWPILLPAREQELAARIVKLAVGIRTDRLVLYNLPAGGAIESAVNRHNVHCDIHRIEGFSLSSDRFQTFDDLKPYISSKLRSELSRNMRNLERHYGPVQIGWCQSVADTEAALDWFVKTKRIDLAARQINSTWIENDAVSDFFKLLSRAVDLGDIPVVATLKVNGSIVSAAICLTGQHALEYFATTYDRSFGRLSPGKLLEYWLIEWALNHQRDFDYRIMRSWYKERGPVTVCVYHTWFVALTLKGRIKDFSEYRRIVRVKMGQLKRKLVRKLDV